MSVVETFAGHPESGDTAPRPTIDLFCKRGRNAGDAFSGVKQKSSGFSVYSGVNDGLSTKVGFKWYGSWRGRRLSVAQRTEIDVN
jgi:hypothetical protein